MVQVVARSRVAPRTVKAMNRTGCSLSACTPGELEHHGDAGRVVLGARRLRHGVEMGADDAVLCRVVEARWRGDDVRRAAGRHPDAPARAGRHVDLLADDGVAELGEPLLHPVGRLGVRIGRPVARTDLASEMPDVGEHAVHLELRGGPGSATRLRWRGVMGWRVGVGSGSGGSRVHERHEQPAVATAIPTRSALMPLNERR